MTESPVDVATFDALPQEAATELLRPVCASAAWQQAVVAGRPYATRAEIAACSDGVIGALGWSDVEEALGAHPRIGDRAAGTDREAAWSRQEQAGAAGSTADVAEALHVGNVEYEQRFGHVFLICATGRTAEQLLATLTDRLRNDVDTEQQVVRRELAAIVRLRLAKALR
jgi:2-oxo-4-hydroxy-4-carboxy-5-ureidoimidazoline decarboxylase